MEKQDYSLEAKERKTQIDRCLDCGYYLQSQNEEFLRQQKIKEINRKKDKMDLAAIVVCATGIAATLYFSCILFPEDMEYIGKGVWSVFESIEKFLWNL